MTQLLENNTVSNTKQQHFGGAEPKVKFDLLDDIITYPGSPTNSQRKKYSCGEQEQLQTRRVSCASEISEYPTDSYYSVPVEPEGTSDIADFSDYITEYGVGGDIEQEPSFMQGENVDMENYSGFLSRIPSFSNIVHPHPEDLSACEPSMKRQRIEHPSAIDQYWLDSFLSESFNVQQQVATQAPPKQTSVPVALPHGVSTTSSAYTTQTDEPQGNICMNTAPVSAQAEDQSNSDENQRNSWTKEEDELLRKAVHAFGHGNFTHVATMVPGRSNTQCRARWVRVLKPGLRKGQWDPEEDQKLLQLIQKYGKKINNRVAGEEIEIDWNNMRDEIKGRSVKQCRERWTKNLDPTLKKGGWTEAEDNLIVQRQKQLGNRWAQISRELPGRTEHSVKTRWRSLVRVHKRHWTSEEDDLLLTLRKRMTNHPGFRWEDVAQQFPNRTKDAVMTRYKVLAAKMRNAAKKN